MKQKSRFMKQIILSTLILTFSSVQVLACEVTKISGSISKIFIDPNTGDIQSDLPNEGMTINKCGPKTTHILISKNTVFQYLNSRSQSVEKTNQIQINKTCSIKNEVSGYEQLNSDLYFSQLKLKSEILNKCLLFNISNSLDQKIEILQSNDCHVVKSNPAGSDLVLQGSACTMVYNQSVPQNIKYLINDDCKTSNFIMQYEAQDVLTQILIQEASNTELINPNSRKAEKFIKGNPEGPFVSRNMILKFLPELEKFPTENDEVSKLNFPSVLSANFHQGQVLMRSFGKQTKFDFEFLVENLSKSFCKDGFCTKASQSVNPVIARIDIYKKNSNRYEKLNSESFYAPLFIPMNWSGLLETSDRGLFVNGLQNLYLVDKVIHPNDQIRIQVDFLDAKDILDDLKMMAPDEIGFSDSTDSNGYSDSLPKMPTLKAPSLSAKLVSLPNIGLGNINVKDLENFGIDMKTSFTHRFKKLCNRDNKCADIKTYEPFDRLVTEFSVGPTENGLISTENIIVQKKSKVFESYTKKIGNYPAIVCQ